MGKTSENTLYRDFFFTAFPILEVVRESFYVVLVCACNIRQPIPEHKEVFQDVW